MAQPTGTQLPGIIPTMIVNKSGRADRVSKRCSHRTH
jgi:hypothetical protein